MRVLIASCLLLLSINMLAVPLPEGMNRIEEQFAVGGVPDPPEPLDPEQFMYKTWRCTPGGNCPPCFIYHGCQNPPEEVYDDDGELLGYTCYCWGGNNGCDEQNPHEFCQPVCDINKYDCDTYGNFLGGVDCGLQVERQFGIDENGCYSKPCVTTFDICLKCKEELL